MADNKIVQTEFLRHKKFFYPESIIPTHEHHCYEITYVLSGSGTVCIDKKNYPYSANSFFVTTPYTHHSQEGGDTEIIYIGFYYNDSFGVMANNVFCDANGKIFQLLSEIESEIPNNDKYSRDIVDEYQKLIICEIMRIQSHYSKSTNNTLSNAVTYICENYYHDINLEHLANHLGYSYHHFRHLFKQEYGTTPNKYIISQRIHHSVILLNETSKTIKEISDECGFNNSGHFIFNFKQFFGCSPTEFRNMHDKNFETYKYLSNPNK